MQDPRDIKDSVSHVEDAIKQQPGENGSLPLPPLLDGLTVEELKRLGRSASLKLDIIIMPAMTIIACIFLITWTGKYVLLYCLPDGHLFPDAITLSAKLPDEVLEACCIVDSNLTAAAKLANIMEDLDLSITEYNSVVSVLFAGYILMQVPSNLIVSKIRWPAIYICAAVVVWGLVSACTAAVHSFADLLACRFFLGIVEAPFFPGAFFYLTLFYTRKQIAFRTAILYSGSQLGNAFGTLFALGITQLDGAHGLEGWRWLFLIEGVLTNGLAVIFACYLPNSQRKIVWLNSEELEWLSWNYKNDQKQEDRSDEITAWQGFSMAVTDPKTWLLMGTLYATYTSAAVNNFFPTVVAGLGFSTTVSYGLTAPPFILCVICMLINGMHSDRTGERYLHLTLPLIVTVIANVIAVSTLNIAARYVAMMLMPASFYSSAIVLLSWISGSISQPAVKRAAAIAIINAMCNTPNIWTAYLYYDSPRYIAAFGVNLGAAVIAIGFSTATFFYLRAQNRKMDRGEQLSKSGPTAAQVAGGFRYML